ncbi:hypothetical protein [Streptomyces sp. NPDC059452]|uniref:hypothetical protein n=1 Tax=Streptomyces sp. NPDC059452 TaxID=3346835 RepID=UPI0036AC8D78
MRESEKLQFVDGPGDSYFFTVGSVQDALKMSEEERKSILLEVGKEGWDTGHLVNPEGIESGAILINPDGLLTLLRNRPVLVIQDKGLSEILSKLEFFRG